MSYFPFELDELFAAGLSAEDGAALERDYLIYGNAIIHLRNGMTPRRVDPLEVFTDLKDSIHPSALPKEGNTMIDHPAVTAVRREKAWLHKLHSFNDLSKLGTDDQEKAFAPVNLEPEQVNAMLRVEYSREHEPAIWAAVREGAPEIMRRSFAEDHGPPLTIEGVAWYCVPSLPEPGWRVINPMKAGDSNG